MASFGKFAAVIAHEIPNPLNFINNFSDINNEMKIEVNAGNKAEALSIADEVKEIGKNLSPWQVCRCNCKKHVATLRSSTGKKNLPTLLL